MSDLLGLGSRCPHGTRPISACQHCSRSLKRVIRYDPVRDDPEEPVRRLEIEDELRKFITENTHCDCLPGELKAKVVYYSGGNPIWEHALFGMTTVDEHRVVVRCEKHDVQGGQSLYLEGKLQTGRLTNAIDGTILRAERSMTKEKKCEATRACGVAMDEIDEAIDNLPEDEK